MALFRFNATTNKLEPITSEGSIGLPVGAVMAFAEGTTNENWLLCDGRDTTGTAEELQTHYPALYTYLGNSNILPALFDHSKLSDYENITIPTTAATAITMDYDGYLFITMILPSDGAYHYIYINGVAFNIGTASSVSGGAGVSNCLPFKKGDVIYGETLRESRVAYYKQPLYIKATSAGIEVDKDLYATKGYIRDQNILADYEDVTISQNSSNPTIMPYDGFLHVRYPGVTGGSGYIRGIAVNGVASSISGQAAAADQYIYVPPVEFQKGDSVYLTSSQTPNRVKARYYKLRDYTGR